MSDAIGFFAGNKAFNIIKSKIGALSNENPNEIIYNGFSIKLCELIEESSIIGVGEPYATMAKMMQEKFKS